MAGSNANRLVFAKLMVADLAVAERFYTEVFGLYCVRRTAPGQPRFGKEEIVLSAGGDADAPRLILVRYVERALPAPGCCCIGFVVEDCAAIVASCRAKGGKVLTEVDPAQAEGRRAALIRDPAGHLVEVIEQPR